MLQEQSEFKPLLNQILSEVPEDFNDPFNLLVGENSLVIVNQEREVDEILFLGEESNKLLLLGFNNLTDYLEAILKISSLKASGISIMDYIVKQQQARYN